MSESSETKTYPLRTYTFFTASLQPVLTVEANVTPQKGDLIWVNKKEKIILYLVVGKIYNEPYSYLVQIYGTTESVPRLDSSSSKALTVNLPPYE